MNNNNKAGGELRHPEGLYDDEDQTTDEGVFDQNQTQAIMIFIANYDFY